MPDSLEPVSCVALCHTTATKNAILPPNTFPVSINTSLHLLKAVAGNLGVDMVRSVTQSACSKIMQPATADLLFNNCPLLPSPCYKARWEFV